MKKLARNTSYWLGLGAICASLFAWHEPMRGPLTEAEIRAAFGPQFDLMQSEQDPQATAFLDFFLSDDGRPFHMVNLNALPEPSAEVDEAARRYGSFMGPRLLVRASYPVLTTDIIAGLNNTLGPGLENAERVVVVRYRSRRDFLNIITTPEFRDAVGQKAASLDGWYSAPASYGGGPFDVKGQLIVMFVLCGLGAGLALRRQNRAPTKSTKTVNL